MGTRDPRIDSYIGKSADFARPILKQLREVVHAGCPEVEETLKWGMPYFMHEGMLCGMAAFKRHCTFTFWKGALVVDSTPKPEARAMGQFGPITRVADLPSKRILIGYVKKAAKLNKDGAPRHARRSARAALPLPGDLAAALAQSKRASVEFEAFPPGRRREYVEWITEAKTKATRERRLSTAIEWIEEGKTRNWKYLK